ncbi:MFS transporter [Luteipulveratus halotolerans]|uniref:Major facilitator superfamily (MFS) profile domain-containing protein n=1 Tax=Luteipulveratus halotolerans TaxID=1631356 RepID=A0A0L6CFH7_9MICO|nr:MFS transporter [Luteipulveratus halotolerans]KNX36360.1 hypothetical protein VV01_03140 [Luteipulveratus halotolerans]
MQPWFRVSLALLVVGWGANHFVTIMPVYRSEGHLSETVVTGMFAAYVLGLAPALVLAARIGQRVGHRLVIRWVLAGSVVGSVLLAVAGTHVPLLFAGRVLYGACMGAAMAPGTTWVKELSAGAPIGTGARRAAIAVSAGFGGGPLVSGALAQWALAPHLLPYVVHIALTLVVIGISWNTPEPPPATAVAASTTPAAHPLRTRAFWSRVAPVAWLVFTCPSVGFVIVPSLVRSQTDGVAIAFTGLMAGITLGTGVLVQQPARRLEARRPGTVSLVGGAASVAALVLAAAVATRPSAALALLTAVALGGGYGCSLVGGLTRVERIAAPHQLAMTNAVFYCLAYAGFFVPTIVSAVSDSWSTRTCLIALAALAAAGTVVASSAGPRRPGTPKGGPSLAGRAALRS